MRQFVLLLVLAWSLPALSQPAKQGSPADPWIAKLADPRESERAVTQLEQLGDPKAIGPIGEAWLAAGRPVRMVQVMIALARPLTPAEAKATFMVDYEKTGRPASWKAALPYLRRAVGEVDEANPRSVDSATKAADALGEAQQGADALATITQRPPSKKLVTAQISAERALGKFEHDKASAVRILVSIVGRARPARADQERLALYLATTGAAVNSLGQLRTDLAIDPLVLALYRTPELMMQLRRALVASGPKVAGVLRKVLRGQHAAVEAMKVDKGCDDAGACHPVAARDFYAAIVLGDLHDASAVPDLLAALAKKPLPAYYVDDQPSPNTQHNAIADALRKLGPPDAEKPLRALWSGTGELETRVLALGAYPFCARDASAAPALVKLVEDEHADDSLRLEAATALARLSRDPKDIASLEGLGKKYRDAALARAKDAAAKRPEADAADKAYEAAKAAATGDKAKLKAAKEAHRQAVAPWKELDGQAKGYAGYARIFDVHAARIEIAARCKDDLACFASAVGLTAAAEGKNVAPFVPDVASWSEDQKRDLVSAAIERAMIELAKRGQAATRYTTALLDHATTEDRLVRQSILLALPAIAPRPCPDCVAKLELAVKAGEGKTTLGDLNLETEILRNYFQALR